MHFPHLFCVVTRAFLCACNLQEGSDNIDDDLDKILQNITKGAVGPDSPKDDANSSLDDTQGGSSSRSGRGNNENKPRTPRHLVYAQHFPLPNDEAYSHEINQASNHLFKKPCHKKFFCLLMLF